MSVNFDRFLYGGDYNPDQWLEYPDILKEDIRLMKQAHINTVSLGIFAWAKLEPSEGVYDFDWMEEIIDCLYENGISVNLATPSGARPHWMADQYPEVAGGEVIFGEAEAEMKPFSTVVLERRLY